MITLLCGLLILACVVVLILLITGVIAVAWPLIILLVLLALDIFFCKTIFGRRKKKEK